MDDTSKGILQFLITCSMIRRIFVGEPYKNTSPMIKKFLVRQSYFKGMERGADKDFMLAFAEALAAYDADLLTESDIITLCEEPFRMFGLEELMYEHEKKLNEQLKTTKALASILTTGGIHIDLTDKPTEEQ